MQLDILEQWLKNKIEKKEISEYLLNNDIQTVIIYGAGKIGEMLYDDLCNCQAIKVECFIDKYADSLYYGIDDMDIYNLNELEKVQPVDAIIITPYLEFESIVRSLRTKIKFRTQYIAFDEIVWKVE